MSKATTLLEAIDIQHLKDVIQGILDKFFGEYDLPLPPVTLKDNLGSGWLARHVCFKDKSKSYMEVQKSILDDDRTLKRVLTHELIHHWQCYHEMTDRDFDPVYKRLAGRNAGHGKSFKEWADKINKIMGDNYVTEKSDQEYLQSQAREFFIVVEPDNYYDPEDEWKDFHYAWFQRPSAQMKDYLSKKVAEYHAKVFKTNDRRFTNGAIFKKYGGMSRPSDKETKDKLKDLYYSGKEVKL